MHACMVYWAEKLDSPRIDPTHTTAVVEIKTMGRSLYVLPMFCQKISLQIYIPEVTIKYLLDWECHPIYIKLPFPTKSICLFFN